MGIRKFAFVAGHDVFTVFRIDDNIEGSEAMIAGLKSEPVIVEVDDDNINIGWKYADGEFWAPAQKQSGPDYELDD